VIWLNEHITIIIHEVVPLLPFVERNAVGSILKQTKRKHQLTIKACIKYVDKKSPVKRPNLQPKIYKSPVVA
jgi:hypothetical protein